LRKTTISFVMPARLSACLSVLWNNSALTGRIFMKFDNGGFFEHLLRKFKFHSDRKRITGTLHEDQYAFFIISRSFLLRMSNISDKVIAKIKTHILCLVTFSENRAVYDIMWKNFVQPVRPRMTIWRMRIACWKPKATNTHTHLCCVILIAFPPQQWLHEHASMLHYTYIDCLVGQWNKTRHKSVPCVRNRNECTIRLHPASTWKLMLHSELSETFLKQWHLV
jgi:hypothetical protein